MFKINEGIGLKLSYVKDFIYRTTRFAISVSRTGILLGDI